MSLPVNVYTGRSCSATLQACRGSLVVPCLPQTLLFFLSVVLTRLLLIALFHVELGFPRAEITSGVFIAFPLISNTVPAHNRHSANICWIDFLNFAHLGRGEVRCPPVSLLFNFMYDLKCFSVIFYFFSFKFCFQYCLIRLFCLFVFLYQEENLHPLYIWSTTVYFSC